MAKEADRTFADDTDWSREEEEKKQMEAIWH